MTLERVLDLIGPVKKAGRGWMAKCPSHQDRSPSLSIREAEDRVLLHCFAGCDLQAICGALGIQVRDLFAGNLSQSEWFQLQHARAVKKQIERKNHIELGRLIDARREAEAFLGACHGKDPSQWNAAQFDRIMNAVGQALLFLREEDEINFYERIGKATECV